jgi:hypothetical protein
MISEKVLRSNFRLWILQPHRPKDFSIDNRREVTLNGAMDIVGQANDMKG